MQEKPTSRPPKREFTSETPTIPAPRNPFEKHEKLLSVSAITIPDPTKNKGEDAYSEVVDSDNNGALFSVEDGVGGYAGGDLAAQAVAQAVRDSHKEFLKLNARRQEGRMPTAGLVAEMELMKKVNKDAWEAVRKGQHENRRHAPEMSTTGVIVRMVRMPDGRFEGIGSSVGDSRAYLQYADGRLESLTVDEHPLMKEMKDLLGREAAVRLQDTLDSLESYQKFENYAKFSKENKWPSGMPVKREDIDFVRDLVGLEKVKSYFDGVNPSDMDPHGRGYYHRSWITGSFGSKKIDDKGMVIENPPHPDYFHILFPAGGKLILVSDGVESLTHEELQGILSGDDKHLDHALVAEADKGLTPAERVAFAARARYNGKAWSPRSKGFDDITVVVAEIPER